MLWLDEKGAYHTMPEMRLQYQSFRQKTWNIKKQRSLKNTQNIKLNRKWTLRYHKKVIEQ